MLYVKKATFALLEILISWHQKKKRKERKITGKINELKHIKFSQF